MKRILVVVMIVSIFLSMFAVFTPKAVASENVIFQDNFESYALGTFPSSGGWQLVYNGAGDQYQVITNSYSVSGTQSLQMVGADGWSAVVAKDFSSSSNIIGYEAYLMASPGAWPSVAFYNAGIVQWGRSYANVGVDTIDGFIEAGSQAQELQSCMSNTWYKIDVVLDRNAQAYNVSVNDVLEGINIPEPNNPWEIQSLRFDVGWHNVLNYYDDVKVFEVSGAPTQSSTSVVCSPNSSGTSVMCTATVSGSNPTGTVTWSTSSSTGNFSQSICTLSNGSCSTTYTDKFTGSVTITASYSGDPNNMPSSSNTTLTVTSARAVQVSFSFQGNFSGSITNGFFDITSGTVTIGAFSYTFENGPPPGYSGTDFNDFHTSTSGDLFAGAINIGDGYVMGLAALYIQTGPTSLSVTFAYGGPPFPGSTAVTSAFDGQIVASINATGNLQVLASTFTLDATGETINAGAQSSTRVACLPNPAIVAQPVTCTAVVSGSSPTGTVTWSTSSSTGNFNQSVCNLINGTCSTAYVDNFIGSVTIVASYNGDPNNSPSSGSFTLTVTSGGPVYYSTNYTSVQAAINAAPPGATVIIAPGFYNESLIVNKPLTIIGEKDPPVFSGGASAIFLTLLSGASGSNVTGIEITNVAEGILVDNASNVSIYGNIMTNLDISGIVLIGSNATNEVIYGNIFQNVPTPISLTASAGNETIYGNAIVSETSVTVDIGTEGNTIYGNSILGSEILVNMTGSNDNVIYHNNFLATAQITILANGNNTWDNGSASGGNYWSTTPTIIGNNNTDHYPLGKPWPLASGHCVGVASIVVSKPVIGQGFSCNLTVCLIDKGAYAETFNVTEYANATAIGTQLINNLNSTCLSVLTLTWNTTGLAYGNYTLSAYAQPVANQTDTSSNTFVLGSVKVTIPGDINGEFKVGLPDLVLLAQAYGSKPGDSNWNPNADIDGNGAVGLSDLVILAQHYGQHYP